MRFFIMLLPWLELLTLIQLGIETSALFALFYVFTTFALGLLILRWQGMDLMGRLRDGSVLGVQMLRDDMATGLAGLLLMFPGLLSDFAAVLVLIGPLRRRLFSSFHRESRAQPYQPQRDSGASGHSTIEGSYQRLDD